MIKCPECGTDNPIGAIFCRGCSKKLNLDDLRPETKDQSSKKMGTIIFAIVRKSIAAAIFLYLAWALVSIFLSVPMGKKAELDLKEARLLNHKYTSLIGKINNSRGEEFVFNSDEITILINRLANLNGKTESKGWALAPIIMDVELKNNGNARILLKANLNNKVDMYTSIEGRFYVNDKQGVYFHIISAHVGRFSLPFNKGKEVAINRIMTTLSPSSDTLDLLKENIKEIEITRDSVSIRLKK
ncbi:MAG: zinc ribbon domain-containing protein [Verrucomicrobiota bacterium]|nr:zinc ribbon domain-containing protein [Verrucomicrobiota bacterium]